MSETLEDIVAEMRERFAPYAKSYSNDARYVAYLGYKEFADRIEAAERGNAAAMREALVRVRDWLKRMNTGALQALAVSQITPAGAVNRSASGLIEDNDFYISVCDAALAAPPRNCDVGTAEEQEERYDAFCAWYYGTNDMSRDNCRICPLSPMGCKLAWAQMPYKKGAQA